MKISLIPITTLLFISHAFAEPLCATMTFESMTLTADGVKKQTQFQERFIRDTHSIWSERIIPSTTTPKEHEHYNSVEGKHEHNLNFATAGKWLIRDENQNIKFRFVRANEKKIIEPRDSEYGTLGFDGVWETAYYLVDRNQLNKMTALKQAAPQGAQWYEKKNATEFTRILWDEKKQIPLKIESGYLDGTSMNKITLVITAPPAKLPWNNLAHYQTQAYEDLLD